MLYTTYGIHNLAAAIVTQAISDLGNPAQDGNARWWLSSSHGRVITSALEVDHYVEQVLAGELSPNLSLNRNTGRSRRAQPEEL